MKRLYTALLMVALMVTASLYTVPVKAQEKQDTIAVVQPVLDGTQKDLADTVQAYASGVADPQLKSVLTDVVVAIKDMPTGDDPTKWYGWIVGVLAAVVAAFTFIKAKFFTKKEPEPPVPNRSDRY